MRLAQLARKLGVKSTDIVEYLASQHDVIEDSFNTKLSAIQVELVKKNFSPQSINDHELTDNVSATAPEGKPAREPDLELVELENGAVEGAASEESQTEVIRAYKVALPGLKVVGKIALPEPKVKEEVKAPADDRELVATNKKDQIPNSRGRKKINISQQDQRPRKNPIALQREREEKEAREKSEVQKSRDKELRTRRYQEKVAKKSLPPKPIAKLRDDDYEVYEEPKQRPSKTWLGKIAGWLVSD